jgi:hypothetical protein
MRRLIVIAALAAGAAACGGDAPGNNAGSVEPANDVGAAAASGRPLDLEPGSWRSEIAVLAYDRPDAPPRLVELGRAEMERLSGRTRCFGPDAVKHSNLPELLSSGPWHGGNCVYTRRTVTTGGVDLAMSCDGLTPGHRYETTIRGTVAPTETDLVIENRSRHLRTGAPWLERYRVRSARIADACEPLR